MTTGIPYMHLNLLLRSALNLRILEADHFLEVGTTDCDVVDFIESILAKAKSNGGFPDSRVSK